MWEKEESRMIPWCFPCSVTLGGGIGTITHERVWIEKQVLPISEPWGILTLKAGRVGGNNKRGWEEGVGWELENNQEGQGWGSSRSLEKTWVTSSSGSNMPCECKNVRHTKWVEKTGLGNEQSRIRIVWGYSDKSHWPNRPGQVQGLGQRRTSVKTQLSQHWNIDKTRLHRGLECLYVPH